MRIDGHRRSSNFEDLGRGGGRARGGGGLPIQLLVTVARRLGLRGTLVAGAIAGVGYFVLPNAVRTQLFATLTGGGVAGTGAAAAKACEGANAAACVFSSTVLASTEDVWGARFSRGQLPRYGAAPGEYQPPTLSVFLDQVGTNGCGSATSAVGPFYCPADRKIYIDPHFYQTMESKLQAPGDFAQAYVIAHEVGHHIQNLIGSNKLKVKGETDNQASVRVELQADCLAGVWGHSARKTLEITPADLNEALTAAHAIGDDSLGHADERSFTHGSSSQRTRWFKRGFESGDATTCDTFGVASYREL